MNRIFLALAVSFCFISLTEAYGATPTQKVKNHKQMRREIANLKQQANQLENKIDQMESQLTTVKKTQKRVEKLEKLSVAQRKSLNSQYYTLGPTVTTSPYLRLRSAYDASDLLVNYPTMNEDLRLLGQRQKVENALKDNVPSYYHPRLVLSGTVQGQVIYTNPYNAANKADVDLSTVELDSLAEVGPWAFGFISLDYDNTATTGGSRIANSRVFLKRGFLTLGNLNRLPVYFSIGQMYVPFGQYSNYLIDDPITKVMGRTNQRAVNVGISRDGFYGQVYGFRGDSKIERTIQSGLNAGYTFTHTLQNNQSITTDFGAGMIRNMADSDGMQSTGGTFGGFSTSSATENLRHAVPALDLHGTVGIEEWTFIGEYIGATEEFDSQDLSYNGHGAKPQSMDAEAAYNTKIYDKPVTLAGDFGYSWDALALNLPEASYVGVFNISLFKDTIESLEYRHDVNYPGSATASGQGTSVTPLGRRSQNTIYGQVAVYF